MKKLYLKQNKYCKVVFLLWLSFIQKCLFRQIEPYEKQSIKGKVVSVLLINPILLYLHDIKKHRRNISALFLLRFVSCLYDESELS